MTSTDVAVRRNPASGIPAKLQYAHELAESGMLPRQYRHQPANVLWAVEYGEMLGLAPMAAITGVHVIEGTPSASAGLISALVRRAGHKLRVRGDSRSATCSIVRSDDPDYTFEVTWTLKRNAEGNPSAEEAGLLGKNTWKNYPASMLKSRAITQCARDACEEALFGLHYTAEELGAEVDEDGAVVAEVVSGGWQQQPAEVAAEEPSPEREWLAKAIEAAPNHASLDACAVVWRRSSELVHDGKLTKPEAGALQDVLRKRMEELKDAPPAESAPPCEDEAVDAEIVTLDAEDPWALAIGEAVDTGEAERLLADARTQAGQGTMDADHLALIEQAIEEAFPGLTAEAQAAA